jgi:hypothetical protein
MLIDALEHSGEAAQITQGLNTPREIINTLRENFQRTATNTSAHAKAQLKRVQFKDFDGHYTVFHAAWAAARQMLMSVCDSIHEPHPSESDFADIFIAAISVPGYEAVQNHRVLNLSKLPRPLSDFEQIGLNIYQATLIKEDSRVELIGLPGVAGSVAFGSKPQKKSKKPRILSKKPAPIEFTPPAAVLQPARSDTSTPSSKKLKTRQDFELHKYAPHTDPGEIVCYHCGKKGHKRYLCPDLPHKANSIVVDLMEPLPPGPPSPPGIESPAPADPLQSEPTIVEIPCVESEASPIWIAQWSPAVESPISNGSCNLEFTGDTKNIDTLRTAVDELKATYATTLATVAHMVEETPDTFEYLTKDDQEFISSVFNFILPTSGETKIGLPDSDSDTEYQVKDTGVI